MHSYQLKSERSFRVVLRGVHHSTQPTEIVEALKSLGHNVTNVHNIQHRTTKHPLSMFFVDLKPGSKNKDVYDINRLLGYVVQIQPPNAKKEVVQCTRCQRFNHTKAFCNRAPRCVKCTSSGHSSSECPRKSRDNNVQCVNCLGRHPANYKGCIVHKKTNGEGLSWAEREGKRKTNTG